MTFFETYPWLLPFFIFFARICDVTFGTMRMRFVSRHYKFAAAFVGFFEVLIWITVISQLIQNTGHWTSYVAYAGGYAAGTLVGMMLEKSLALGKVMIRIIPVKDASQLIDKLRDENFGVTCINAEGARGPVKIIFTIVPSSAKKKVVQMIKTFNPKAFFTIEEVGDSNAGILPMRQEKTVGVPRQGK